MANEGRRGFNLRRFVQECEKRGIPVTRIKVNLTPEQQAREAAIKRDVHRYVMGIEKAHQMAAHSTLKFKA